MPNDKPMPTCAACGAAASEGDTCEAHHLVPQAIHEHMSGAMLERWKGATVPLCPRCHREWHDVVTPYLGGWSMTSTRKAAAKWILAHLPSVVAVGAQIHTDMCCKSPVALFVLLHDLTTQRWGETNLILPGKVRPAQSHTPG